MVRTTLSQTILLQTTLNRTTISPTPTPILIQIQIQTPTKRSGVAPQKIVPLEGFVTTTRV